MKSDDERARQLGRIAELPVDHPDRIAFEADPESRALLKEYVAFLSAEPAAGSEPARAREALDATIASATLAPGAGPRRPARGPAARRRGWWTGASVAAAAIVVLAVGIRLQGDDPAPPSGVQRGDREAAFRALHVETSPEALLFRWTAVPGADRYEVMLYADDLSEILHSPATVDTFLSLDVDGLDTASLAAWRVVATARGDEIARSTLGGLGEDTPPESHR